MVIMRFVYSHPPSIVASVGSTGSNISDVKSKQIVKFGTTYNRQHMHTLNYLSV